jgi:hypothetical protein
MEEIINDENHAIAQSSASGCSAAHDHTANPSDMAADYLVELAFQLYARACSPLASEELHNRAMELEAEVLRRVQGN